MSVVGLLRLGRNQITPLRDIQVTRRIGYPMPSVSCDVNAHVGKDRKVEHGLSLIARGIVHDVHTSVRPTPCRADQYLEGSVILLKQVFIDLKTAAHTTH